MNGFDPELPTYLIWEGNTMYLPLACDKAILHQLKGNLKRFSVSFDYFATAMIARTTGVGGLTRMTVTSSACTRAGSPASTTSRRLPTRST